MATPPAEITTLLEKASCLYSAAEVESAIENLAGRISEDFKAKNPILLPVMNGGLPTAASLMKHFEFPLQLDYVHLTRYRDTTSGGDINWIYRPRIELKGREVILIDDLLDHGITLNEAVVHCRDSGAKSVSTVVLVVKQIQNRPGLKEVDYFALQTPDKYLFGYGMDYKSYWRNAPGIFAI